MSDEKTLISVGRMRLFVEVRYDFKFEHEKPMTVKETVETILSGNGGLHGIVADKEGTFAEIVTSIAVSPINAKPSDVLIFEGEDLDKLMLLIEEVE